MSKDIYSYLVSSLRAGGTVSDDLLLEAMTYVEYSQGRPADCLGPAVAERLAAETITPDDLQNLKQALVDVVVTGRCETRQITSVVYTLAKFDGRRLAPLLTSWLDDHLRRVLDHSAVVSQLLITLNDLGEAVPHRSSGGTTMVEQNIDVARQYLGDTLGLTYPW